MGDKEKHLRWLQVMWDLHKNISREEKRKAEVLKIFEDLCELAGHRLEVPYFPPWEHPQS